MSRLTPFALSLVLLGSASVATAQDLLMFDTSSFGRVVLSQSQSAISDVRLEAQIGDYNNEFISNYGATSIFARTGKAVGRLDILTDKGHAPCTAFLVAENRLITNHHCVPGVIENERLGASAILAVQLRLGYVRDGVEEGTEMFHVNPVPVETDKDLDYSVLEIIGGDANAAFGALELSAAMPSDRDPFWVIGHPMGEAQRISREKCQADSPAISGRTLRHTCDTLPGNSGSPVIDAGLQQVVALHNAGSRAGAVNFAIPMAEILKQSRVLKASAARDAAPVADARDLTALERELNAAIARQTAMERDLRLAREAQEAAEAALRDRGEEDLAALAPAREPPAPPAPVPAEDRAGLAPGDEGLRIVIAAAGDESAIKGSVVIDLFEEVAPAHVARIARLARDGAYDNVVFHRVIDGFMAQTGDVQYGSLSGQEVAVGMMGTGGSEMPDIAAEFSDIAFERGVVGMARAGDPDSANSQFFIMFDDKPFLNGQYTVIGRVIEGMDVVDGLKRWDQSGNGFNGAPDSMLRVTFLD